jgi:ankyrin repeat protein
MKINLIIDDEGYTLLHMASFQNMTKILKLLIEKSKQVLDAKELKQWINHKTAEDGFTSLHYAAWKGNIQIMRTLIENDADL